MKKIDCIDTHTHTQFWNEKHFLELDKKTKVISLDSFIQIPKKIQVHTKKQNIIYGYGIQPYTEYKLPELEKYLISLEEEIQKENVMLLGELGLDSIKDKEIYLFKEQVYLAKKYDLNMIIHTSSKNKLKTYKEIYSLLTSYDIKPEKAIIDHMNQDMLNWHIPEYFVGITIQKYGKLSEEEAINVIFNNTIMIDKFVINSDYSNLEMRKQPVKEVNLVKRFKNSLAKIDIEIANSVTYKNPLHFLGEKK
jgi:hypothetical protein